MAIASVVIEALPLDGVRFIVSYADPVMNGTATPTPASKPWAAGGIYAAANYTYLGKVPPEHHFRDHTGRFVHRRVPYRLMKRQQAAGKHMTMADAVRERGLTPWRMPPKERWFIDLGKHSVVASSRRGLRPSSQSSERRAIAAVLDQGVRELPQAFAGGGFLRLRQLGGC